MFDVKFSRKITVKKIRSYTDWYILYYAFMSIYIYLETERVVKEYSNIIKFVYAIGEYALPIYMATIESGV